MYKTKIESKVKKEVVILEPDELLDLCDEIAKVGARMETLTRQLAACKSVLQMLKEAKTEQQRIDHEESVKNYLISFGKSIEWAAERINEIVHEEMRLDKHIFL